MPSETGQYLPYLPSPLSTDAPGGFPVQTTDPYTDDLVRWAREYHDRYIWEDMPLPLRDACRRNLEGDRNAERLDAWRRKLRRDPAGAVVIYGHSQSPTHGEALRRKYGRSRLLEHWDGVTPLHPDTVALTFEPPPYQWRVHWAIPFYVAVEGGL